MASALSVCSWSLNLAPKQVAEVIPESFWHDQRFPAYGRLCMFSPAAALDLFPGEMVRLDPTAEARIYIHQ